MDKLEQRYLTPEQLEIKYGPGRKASIMPDAKPNRARPFDKRTNGQAGREVEAEQRRGRMDFGLTAKPQAGAAADAAAPAPSCAA